MEAGHFNRAARKEDEIPGKLHRGDGGNLTIQSAAAPQRADAPSNQRISAYGPKSPEFIPQVVFAAEHYNRINRMLQRGQRVKLEMHLDVAIAKADSCFNIVAEIPGTDLKDDIVQTRFLISPSRL